LIVGALEFSDAGPRTNATSLNRIPSPGTPGFALAIGFAIEAMSGVIGLLDEASGIGRVDDVFRIAAPGEPGDRSTFGAVDTDFDCAILEHEQIFFAVQRVALGRRRGGKTRVWNDDQCEDREE